MPNETPSWLVESCPSWCVVVHREDDHLDDRKHESTVNDVPGVIRRCVHQATPVGALEDVDHPRTESVAVDVYVERYRRVGESQDWVVLGTADECLEMSWETAQRVGEVLCGLVGNRSEVAG